MSPSRPGSDSPAHDPRAGRSSAGRQRWDEAVVPPWEPGRSASEPAGPPDPPETDRFAGDDVDGGWGPPQAGGGGDAGDPRGPDGPDGPGGPGGSGGAGRAPRPHRRLKVVLGVVLVLALAACTSAGALLWYGRSNIEQTSIEGISPSKGRTVTLSSGQETEILNVLLVGVDNPGTLTEEERARVAPDERTGRRPDVVILAQVEVGGDRAGLLSFPRDLRIELCDGNVDKINAAFHAGERSGLDPESCLVRTVTDVTGIDIDHYVEVDFGGFVRVVEALGGVTMYLDEPMIDRKAHLDVPAGCVTLTPEQALGYVRSRGYDDDYGRIARQQRFIKETLEEARRVGVVGNPARLFALVDRASRAVRTDDGLGLSEMRDLAFGLRNMTSDHLVSYTVPSEPAEIGGVAYVVADDEAAGRLYASFRDGSVLEALRSDSDAPGGGATEAATEAREGSGELPPVVVLNAAGVSGLATRTAELLEAGGMRVASVGNADEEHARTEIVHGTGLERQADALADALGQGRVRHEGGGAPLTLVLGSDYDPDAAELVLGGIAPASVEVSPSPPQSTPEGSDVDAMATQPAAEPTEPTDPEPSASPTAEASPTPVPEETPTFRGTQRPDDVDC